MHRHLPSTARWKKASASAANGQCVEVADLGDGEIGLRDSKDRHGVMLRFTREEWHAFLVGAKAGEFDTLA
jgi:hypothetical protein